MTDSKNYSKNTESRENSAFTLSFLLSKEEYIALSTALSRRRQRGAALLRRAVGLIVFCLGLAGVCFGDQIRIQPLTGSLVALLGLFLLLYDLFAAPLFCAAAAAGEYEADRYLRSAKRYIFSMQSVRLEQGDSFLELPLSALTAVYRLDGGLVLSFGEVFEFMIPNRVLESEDAARLDALLAQVGNGV